jgi:hypothetical protein
MLRKNIHEEVAQERRKLFVIIRRHHYYWIYTCQQNKSVTAKTMPSGWKKHASGGSKREKSGGGKYGERTKKKNNGGKQHEPTARETRISLQAKENAEKPKAAKLKTPEELAEERWNATKNSWRKGGNRNRWTTTPSRSFRNTGTGTERKYVRSFVEKQEPNGGAIYYVEVTPVERRAKSLNYPGKNNRNGKFYTLPKGYGYVCSVRRMRRKKELPVWGGRKQAGKQKKGGGAKLPTLNFDDNDDHLDWGLDAGSNDCRASEEGHHQNGATKKEDVTATITPLTALTPSLKRSLSDEGRLLMKDAFASADSTPAAQDGDAVESAVGENLPVYLPSDESDNDWVLL